MRNENVIAMDAHNVTPFIHTLLVGMRLCRIIVPGIEEIVESVETGKNGTVTCAIHALME